MPRISSLTEVTSLLDSDELVIARAGVSYKVKPSVLGGSVVNVRSKAYAGGAKGDDTTDDTAALQAAINTVTLTGGRIFVPNGTYKITAALTVPASAGWIFEGQSRLGAIIKQYTANTPIFRFASTDTHSWTIRSLSLTYNTQQPSTNTAAACLYVDGPTGIYNWKVEDVLFTNCCDCFSGDEADAFTNWGGLMKHCFVGSNVTRSVFRVQPTPTVGEPNNRFEDIYIRADSMVGPLFVIQGGEQTTMAGIEINQAHQGPTIVQDYSGGSWTIDAIKVEGGTYGTGAAAVNPFFDTRSTPLVIGQVHLTALAANSGGGGTPAIFRTQDALVQVGELHLLGWTITGFWYVAKGLGGTSGAVAIEKVNALPTNMYLTDVPNSADPENVEVRDWNRGRVSADKGDANYTVALGDPNIIRYATTLTAQRTVTLPTGNMGISCNLFNGLTYKVVRTGGGAFNLLVKDGGGATLATLAAAGIVEFTWQRNNVNSGWVQTQ